MKNASRIFALVLALAMLMSLSAFASGDPSGAAADEDLIAIESIDDLKVSSYATLDAVATRSQDNGFIYVGYDVVDGELTGESNWTGDITDITLNNAVTGAGFTAVRASGEMSDVTVNGGTLVLTNGANDSEGEHASDFTGMGAAFVSYDGAKLTVKDVDVTTDGFVRAGVIVDHGAVGWIEDSSFVTYGANPLTEAYDGYVNSATTSKMLSPPWVLGIQGGIRTVNVLDTEATFVLVNSTMASGGWGVVSTDGCTKPTLIIIDSELSILPESEGGMDSGAALYGDAYNAYGSGYGAYLIGSCDEQYYGSVVSGATFGAIAREGYATYQSSKGDIQVVSAKGEDLGTVKGQGNVSEINTVIGVMTHSSEDVGLTYTDGTIINTAAETVLYRSSGHADFVFDNAVVNPGNGVIVQMIDDDDSTVGMGDFSTMGFNTALIEAAGMPSQNGNETGESASNEMANVVFMNGDYEGDLYNGTGYYGQAGDVMNVTVGENAALEGAIALTETFHGVPYSAEAKAFADAADGVEYVFIDKDFNVTDKEADAAYIQFTQFTIDQYYMLCRMMNHIYSNGYAGVNVTVEKDGEWDVTGESLISYLKVEGTVKGELTENADGTLTLVPSAKTVPAGEYGSYVEANVAAAQSMGNAGGSAEPEGITTNNTASDAPSAEAPAAVGASVEDAFVEYIHEWLLNELENNSSMTIEQIEDEFMPLIEAGDYVSFPAEMLWNGMLNTGMPMTFEEFAAQY